MQLLHIRIKDVHLPLRENQGKTAPPRPEMAANPQVQSPQSKSYEQDCAQVGGGCDLLLSFSLLIMK